jgi:branched-chain amino acid transport system permease protein
VASGITIAVGAALVLFFRFTTMGRAIRSVIQDEEGARLVGVNPAMVRTVIFGLSSGLAGLVALTRSMTSPVDIRSAAGFTIFALIVAVVGGLGSVSGAFLAGVLLGVVSAISRFYIGQYITEIVLLLAAAITIVARPAGLLGRST